MIDIVGYPPQHDDLGLYDTDTERAKNILSVQIGALSFIPDFGIDLKYFLSENFVFENESFKSYLVQRLSEYAVNVTQLIEEQEDLYEKLIFLIGTSQVEGGGMVAR